MTWAMGAAATSRAGVLAIAALAVWATAGVGASAATLQGPVGVASSWRTTPDGRERLSRAPDVPIGPTVRDAPSDVTVDARDRHQSMLGFGASLTSTSAHLIMGLGHEERERLMRELFGSSGGIALSYLRQPIGPTDFVPSLPHAPFESGGVFDPSHDEREVLPLLRLARRHNGALRVMGTPWTAPAWMKDTGRLEGGRLRPEAHGAYADYLVSAVLAYRRAGVPIEDLTTQNEPQHEASYPSMTMTAEEQASFIRVLDERLTAAGLNTRLFAFDHNWDGPGYALEVLARDRDVTRLEGAAFHCYAGDPEAQAAVREAGWRVLHTECSGIDSEDRSRTFRDTLHWQAERLLVRGPRTGSETAVTWNLALDATGGPHVGACGDRCNGVVEIAGGTYRRNAEFFVLGHAARFVRPGARRIGSTGAGHPAVRHVAFVNPDGTRVLIVLNTAEQDERLGVGDGERAFTLPVPAGALVTVTWPGDPPPAAGRSRLDPSGWTIDASSVPAHPCCTGDLPQHAIDGDPRTRWTTGEPQRPGQWLTIDLGARRRFDTLVIDDGRTGDHPRGYAVHAGDDPGALGPPIATGSGTRGALTITFAPVTAQHVRIVQTGTSGRWWSVHDLALLARGAGRTGVRPR